MTDVEEFRQKVSELHDKVDLKHETFAKNKTFLQSIKELCAHTLESPDISPQLEKEVKQTLFKTENELAELKKGIMNNPNLINKNIIGQQQKITSQAQHNANIKDIGTDISQPMFTNQMAQSVLNSVEVTPFDPNSSPILRRLMKNKKQSLGSNSKQGIEQKMERETEQKSLSDSSSISSNKSSNVPSNVPSKMSSLKSIQNNLKKQDSPFAGVETAPFPINKNNNPENPNNIEKKDKDEESIITKNIEFEFPQLKTTYNLFLKPNEPFYIGREIIENLPRKVKVPKGFFDPIAKERHFSIEYIPGNKTSEIVIKDPDNLEKTYLDDHFIDSVGDPIKEGTEFILPVNVDNKLASLLIKIHIKN